MKKLYATGSHTPDPIKKPPAKAVPKKKSK